jgi:hypothetical protein
MAVLVRCGILVLALSPLLRAAPPAALASALEYLRDQKSYSWETINSDPGPVAQQFETRRGKVTTVQRSLTPNLKGQVDRNGDMLIQREWPDGLRLDTVITADGTMVTLTPDGWMTDREILTAQAEERLRAQTPTPRQVWLRRADRPDIRRPDQELVPLLKSNLTFEPLGDAYVVRLRSRSGDPARPNDVENEPATEVTVTMNLRGGIIRDYEVKLEGTQRATRARIAVPVSEQRVVIVTYVPVNRLNLPPAAREKLAQARNPSAPRTP